MRHFDAAIMFGSLWLLASMVLDLTTPNELTFAMIGAAIAPAIAISALLYWLRVPRLDLAIIVATLWMVSVMVLEMITPKPLSPFMALVAFIPLAIVGTIINVQAFRARRAKAR